MLTGQGTDTVGKSVAEVGRRIPSNVSEAYGKLPLSFEANTGQVAQPVKFLSRGKGYTLFLTGTEAVVALSGQTAKRVEGSANLRKPERESASALRMRFLGGNPAPQVAGEDRLQGEVNYLIGNQPEKWRTGVQTYSRVRYTEVYPGIDVVYYGNQRQLEYDFVVAPGANPSQIRLSFAGARHLRVDANGDLVMRAGTGELRQLKPVIYQEVDGVRRLVTGGYVLKGRNQVEFLLGSYDRSKTLVIDPVLSYSTYVGGSAADYSEAIAIDATGHAYISGYTRSIDFPTTAGALKTKANTGYNVFVSKLNPAGTALVYSTFVGGSASELSGGLAVDATGQAYLTGNTVSNDFPTTAGAFQTARGGELDVFVSKLNPAGNGFAYSTLIGGGDNDHGSSIAVDAAGNAYVTGMSGTSADGQIDFNFPTTPGAFQRAFGGTWGDAYALKLNPTGTSLLYSTLLGGSGREEGKGIAVDAAGNAYVVGRTESFNFPTTPGAFQTTGKTNGFYAPVEAFITKLNDTGTALIYSTYLGGINDEDATGIALDGSGHAYVTGYTSSPSFPTTPGTFQPAKAANDFSNDAYAVKLNPAGTALVYSTFIGGGSVEFGLDIAADRFGNAYVAGLTSSDNFPLTTDAFAREGGAFLTQLNPSGAGLHSLRYGGTGGFARFSGVAADQAGNVFVTGYTNATNFPTTTGAYRRAYGGGESDSFVVKFSGFRTDDTPSEPNTVQFSAANFEVAEGAGRATVTVSRSGDISGQASVRYLTVDNQAVVPCNDSTTAPDTAFARCDYSTTIDTLNFAAGEATKTFDISIIDDAHVENAEKVQLSLADPVGASLGATHAATLTITNNDAPGAPNPIFDNTFFVRQHYLDFLSREPEPEGMAAWTGVLSRCPDVNNDPRCDRLTVSAAFFRSVEFQLKGYFVYRFYKVSFGRLPLYNEIVTDMRSITGETAEEVYAKRNQFVDDWVKRPAFKSSYDHLEPRRFVDTLMNRHNLFQITTPDPANPNGTAKVTFTRDALVDEILSRRLTYAQVVRAIADSDEVFNQEYNRAFVAMQYYGYLRRTPEEEGYNNWLRVINEDPQNVRLMINGFMNSVEYRLRFGDTK
ncbi:MAG TPA: SBBP repeat-containing protein [Pyrinomonadaceae bacterium]|nr:SBBP repeat-containing protein [Pyrinomonadaceae bacterium]